MKLKEKMKNNNHKKFDKKKLIGTIIRRIVQMNKFFQHKNTPHFVLSAFSL